MPAGLLRRADLGTLGGPYSSAATINDHGQIAGIANRPVGQGRSVMWTVHFNHHIATP